MKLDYLFSEASKDVLLSFLDSVLNNPNFRPNDKELARSLYDIWHRFICNYIICTRHTDVKSLFSIREIYPLEHVFPPYEIVMHFDVTSVHELLRNGKLVGEKVMLSQSINEAHYSETGDTVLCNTSFQDPVLIVFMPTMDNSGKLRSGEVIDGNHRVSAAVASGIDIPVTRIMNVFLPKEAFLNDSSWILYHVLSGASIIPGNYFSTIQQSQYINQLDGFLRKN